ncbi:MAG TPA: hypothetical protein VE871_16885 [Longimicrobium sp.]|nr:hypothetical protein [Longimicrobium sp.]
MAVAIAIGAGFFARIDGYVLPTLPLHQGERVIGIQSWDDEANQPETGILHDFADWRGALRTVDDPGAYQTLRRNLIVPGAPAEAGVRGGDDGLRLSRGPRGAAAGPPARGRGRASRRTPRGRHRLRRVAHAVRG